MSARSCQLLETTARGQQVVGTLTISGGKISARASAGREADMRQFMDEAAAEFARDPEAWFEGLPRQYNGSYLRARMVGAVRKYSPDQPRGEGGQWVTVYHGSTAAGAAGIRSSGRISVGETGDIYVASTEEGARQYLEEVGAPGGEVFPVRVRRRDLVVEDKYPDGSFDARLRQRDVPVAKYSDDQARDEQGRWAAAGASSPAEHGAAKDYHERHVWQAIENGDLDQADAHADAAMRHHALRARTTGAADADRLSQRARESSAKLEPPQQRRRREGEVTPSDPRFQHRVREIRAKVAKYASDQERDSSGRFAGSGAAGAGSPTAPALAPIPPPNERWTADRGAIPGEPGWFLDDGSAALVERELPQGNLFDAVLEGGEVVGSFGTVEEAARAAETAARARRKVAKYSEDQQRDDHGRWSTSGEGGEYYHGTSAARAEKILVEGLKSGYAAPGYDVVYASRDKREAMQYAVNAAWAEKNKTEMEGAGLLQSPMDPKRLVALVIIDPARAGMGELEDQVGSYRTRFGPVPADAIKRVELYEYGELASGYGGMKPVDGLKPVRVIRKAVASADEVYVVVLFDDAQKVAKYSEDQARDERGRWTEGGGSGEAFVSPNVQEGTTFADAEKALSSERQAQFHSLAERVIDKVDSGGEVADTIGDWSDGAENSMLVRVKTSDFDQVRYITAVLGDKADQKAVLPFVPARGGQDSLYRFDVKVGQDGMEGVRRQLDQAGIYQRTLEARGETVRVHIYDPGSKLQDQVERAGDHYDVSIERIRGRGEFLGGDTREEGHRAYAAVISDYERRHPERAWKSGGGPHGGVRGPELRLHRDAAQETEVLKYSEDQPRDAGGKWTEGGGGGAASGSEYYHGTSIQAAEHILREGLKPDPGYGYNTVYASTDKTIAMLYARTTAFTDLGVDEDRDVALVVVDPEKSGMRGQEWEPKAYVTAAGSVPAEAIKRVEIYRAGDLYEKQDKAKPVRVVERGEYFRAAGAREMYLLVVLPEAAAIGKREGAFKFGSTQVDLQAMAGFAQLQAKIDAADLMAHGLEADAHVTVCWGLEDPAGASGALRRALASVKPFEVRFGKTAKFEPGAHSEGSCPIYVQVAKGDRQLRALNTLVRATTDVANSDYSVYTPHLTVAYVRPEAADKYVGLDDLAGAKASVGAVTLTGRDGEKMVMPLGVAKYSEDQPRDDHGKWTEGGGGQASGPVPGERWTGGPASTAMAQQEKVLAQEWVESSYFLAPAAEDAIKAGAPDDSPVVKFCRLDRVDGVLLDRGTTVDEVEGWKPGDTVQIFPRSFTDDGEVAEQFADGAAGKYDSLPAIIEIKGGATGWDLREKAASLTSSDYASGGEREVVIGGHFEVISIDEGEIYTGKKVKVVTLRQKAVF